MAEQGPQENVLLSRNCKVELHQSDPSPRCKLSMSSTNANSPFVLSWCKNMRAILAMMLQWDPVFHAPRCEAEAFCVPCATNWSRLRHNSAQQSWCKWMPPSSNQLRLLVCQVWDPTTIPPPSPSLPPTTILPWSPSSLLSSHCHPTSPWSSKNSLQFCNNNKTNVCEPLPSALNQL